MSDFDERLVYGGYTVRRIDGQWVHVVGCMSFDEALEQRRVRRLADYSYLPTDRGMCLVYERCAG